MRSCLRVLFVLSIAALFTASAEAQYFGRNKVQWESFDFKTIRTAHFDIYYYEQEEDVVQDVGRMAERWYERLSRTFNHSFTRKPIVLYANPADFHQTTTTGGLIGEGTGGFTDQFMNRVVLPLTGDYAENDHVLGHEIVHVFQYDIAATANNNRRRFNLQQMPLWIVEGMAEYLSKGRVDPLTSMWIRDATVHDRLPDLRKLMRDSRYFPYRYGQAIMAYIGARFGDEAVVRYFMAAGMVGIEEGFERALGITHKQFFTDWNESARELYNPVVEARTDTLTKPLLGSKPVAGAKSRRSATDLNIGPALSPDGKYIAFLSTRELFDIDLFLADAHTGNIIRRLVSTDRDSHFESLRFIESAGGWSPDSRKLAFITFAKGDNYLSIVDVDSRNAEHHAIPGVDAITQASWSPDGRSLVLSGQATGVSDLFIYNLDTKQVRRLTSDKHADMHPAWSPDGRTIAFTSDRGRRTSFEGLAYADHSIATIDVGTGAIRVLPLFSNSKHINPQWAPDSRSLYFIANPQGIPDVYRYHFDGDRVEQVTAVRTGVAGITDTAPALSVASKTGDIAFALFEDDRYNIYTLPPNAPAIAVASRESGETPRAAILPPLRGTGSAITAYLETPAQDLLPVTTRFEERPYNAELRLAYLGPPTVGVGADQFGFGVGGSVTAYFSDILGQHNVGFTFQGGGSSTSRIQDQLGGELMYLNQTHRFNWGGDLVHVPYTSVSNGYGTAIVDINGKPTVADVYQQAREIQTVTDATGIAQYPFSATRRIEGAAGYQRYAYKAELETWIVVGGSIVDRSVEALADNFSLNFYKASTAFVGDSSVFGFISPVRGTRYRYEVETMAGDLNFSTALADYRRYIFMRPVTLAFRGLHYGRYGSGAEDNRLRPLYLGNGNLVRGYDPYSFDPSVECNPVPGSACPVFDRLVGTRIAAGSVEARVPLLGTREFGLINAPFLPTELLAFADVGAAWSEGNSVNWTYATNTNDRVPVFSVGIGARILLAYIPIEVYAAKPFQRPGEDIVYGFNIVPGW
ncbi:MAG TPA: BamA/TamA family outer membrane protein [Thermoanaerobaculia bacterium]